MGIKVSDHAVIRYMERVLGLDVDKFRKTILPDEAKDVYRKMKVKDLTYNCGDFRVVIKENLVVTIMTKGKNEVDNRKKNHK